MARTGCRTNSKQLDRLYARDRGFCWACGTWIPRDQATRDHMVAWSKDGDSSDENMRIACGPCNVNKSDNDLTPEELHAHRVYISRLIATGEVIAWRDPIRGNPIMFTRDGYNAFGERQPVTLKKYHKTIRKQLVAA